jgi:hypothetical protein
LASGSKTTVSGSVDFLVSADAGMFTLDLPLEAPLEGDWELRLSTGVGCDFTFRGSFAVVVDEFTTTAVGEQKAAAIPKASTWPHRTPTPSMQAPWCQ